ncbi:MAG: sulfotransferase [Flavobacteriaceae bacterium]|nr:sulfotransferase [Flavobacteriaceae bacterium]
MKFPFKKQLLSWYYSLKSFGLRKKWKGNQRIFILSLQKTGTTSTGDFFVHFGYPVVRSDLAQLRHWNAYWYQGEFEKIFQDTVFKNHQVFEDAPFWATDFYQILYKKFPDAKFVLLTRNSQKWFDSLAKHGNGKAPGNAQFHARIYGIPEAVEKDFNIYDHQTHYLEFYEKRNQEIIHYFDSKQAEFIHIQLEDPLKWQKLATFAGLELNEEIRLHSNPTEP